MGTYSQSTRYSRLMKAVDLSENVVGLLSDPSKRYVHGSSSRSPNLRRPSASPSLPCQTLSYHIVTDLIVAIVSPTRVLFFYSRTVLVTSATILATLSNEPRNSRKNLTPAIRRSVKKRWHASSQRSLRIISFQRHTKLRTWFRISHMPLT